MAFYTPPQAHYQFILNQVLEVAQQLPDYDADTTGFMLETAGQFAQKELAPLYTETHRRHGHADLTLPQGQPTGMVTLPEGFEPAYRLFVETGLQGIVADPNYGAAGLGQPHVVGAVIDEIMHSANGDFSLIPTLTHSAYLGIYSYGTEAQKQRYLPELASGQSSGIMAMTESGAGSDLSNVKTLAEPQQDGSYHLSGQKIYISGGDNHYTGLESDGNIIHVVLAKIKQGEAVDDKVSMFIVPKVLVAEDGTRRANALGPVGVEWKMGMPGSATCTMAYLGAEGELIGERGKGIATMFAVMNEARNHVARQAIGCMEAAFQKAWHFATDPESGRRMGRALEGAKDPDKEADLICEHPAVRKLLLNMRSTISGARMFQLDTALQMDLAAQGNEQAAQWVSLMTNIVKAHITELGSQVTDHAIQVFGGMGYVEETGIACHYRDVRVTRIYEGTNQIQALTLWRQLPHLPVLWQCIEELIATQPPHYAALQQALEDCQQVAEQLSAKDITHFASGADEFLELIGTVALGYYHCRAAAKADLCEDPTLAKRIRQDADFYIAHILPNTAALKQRALAGIDVLEI